MLDSRRGTCGRGDGLTAATEAAEVLETQRGHGGEGQRAGAAVAAVGQGHGGVTRCHPVSRRWWWRCGGVTWCHRVSRGVSAVGVTAPVTSRQRRFRARARGGGRGLLRPRLRAARPAPAPGGRSFALSMVSRRWLERRSRAGPGPEVTAAPSVAEAGAAGEAGSGRRGQVRRRRPRAPSPLPEGRGGSGRGRAGARATGPGLARRCREARSRRQALAGPLGRGAAAEAGEGREGRAERQPSRGCRPWQAAVCRGPVFTGAGGGGLRFPVGVRLEASRRDPARGASRAPACPSLCDSSVKPGRGARR